MELNYINFSQLVVKVNSGETEFTVKERCRERAHFLLKNYLPVQLNFKANSLPNWLDPTASEEALGRIRAMLQRLKVLLEELSSSNLDKLKDLHRLDWSPDRHFVSTPILWAITALIFSHTKWTESNCHDIRSAIEVEEIFRQNRDSLNFLPQWMLDKISLLVALKNAYRTCVNSGMREVGIYRNRSLSFEESEIALAMAKFLKSCFSNDDAHIIANALLLIGYAYAGRHGEIAKFPVLERFTRLVEDGIVSLSNYSSGTLIVFEFGRHVFPQIGDNKTLLQDLLNELVDDKNLRIVWLSFDRFWATRHSDSLRFWLEAKAESRISLVKLFKDVTKEIPPFRSLQAKLSPSAFYALTLEGEDAYKVAFGCLPEKNMRQKAQSTVWERISTALKPFLERRGHTSEKGAIPWAYVMRILKVLGYIYPDEFFNVKLERPDSPKVLSDNNNIDLPRTVPEISELENAIKADKWHNPQLLVSRCLATLLMNQRLAFGNKQQVIKINSSAAFIKAEDLENSLEQWLALAKWAANKNCHNVFEKYLQTFLTPKIQPEKELPLILPPSTGKSHIAGIDIGGTFIKAAVYEYYPGQDFLGESVFTCHTFETVDVSFLQYQNALSFVERLNKELIKVWGDSWAENLIAIGLTWPGAVAGEIGHEYIAAYSKSLGYFKPFDTKHFYKATAEEIHKFDIREAFQNYFKKPVTLMNDGVAHVYYHQWQLNREVLGIGETIVGLFAGTGSAEAVFDGNSGYPLQVLAELGKQIDDIGCEFPTRDTGSYPEGVSRNYFNKDTLPNLAKEVLKDWHISISEVPGLVIGWILENLDQSPSKDALKRIRQLWEEEQLQKGETNPKQIDAWLTDLNATLIQVGKKDEDFAKEVAKRAGLRLADLIAQVRELYGSFTVFVGGGPMSNATGRFIRNEARKELRQGYGFDVVVGNERNVVKGIGSSIGYVAWRKHHRVRLLRFPEPPHIELSPPGPSGSRGAAMRATTLFSKSRNYSHPASLLSFSTFSVIKLGKKISGRVYFPGRASLPPAATAGYIRSHLQASQAWKVVNSELENRQKMSIYSPLPWRDYDEDLVLTSIDDLVKQIINNDKRDSKTRNHLIMSARNTINEWRYEARLDGKWYRRLDDVEIDQDWPVIEVGEKKIGLTPYKKASPEMDLVTGIPLVIDGNPSSRTFLVAHCSDVAHVYQVDPGGRLGSSALAWRELSGCWKHAKDEGVEDYELEQRMNKIAARYDIRPSQNLLHSILAVNHEGDLIAFAITGSLSDIAKDLINNYKVYYAVLLDNGGSVGWHTLLKGKIDRVTLVAGPNYRPRGTVFIDLWVDDFIHPRQHEALSVIKEER